MRIAATILICMVCSVCAYAQGVPLDPAFGTAGIVTTAINYGSFDEAHSVVCQSDGKIIAAGMFGSATPGLRTVMVRYNKNGSVDLPFGVGGKVEVIPTSGNNSQTGLVGLQKIGESELIILADRYVDVSSNFSLVAKRYKPDGTLDPTFGVAGTTVLTAGYPRKMIVDTASNAILFAGSTANGSNFDVFRLLHDGQVDNAFGTSGHATRQDTFSGISEAILVQKDGKILVGGATYKFPAQPDPRMAIVRYLPNGTVDSAFGTDGYAALTTDSNFYGNVTGLAVQSDDKIIACAQADTGTGMTFYLTRLLQNGQVDATFGDGGGILTDFGNNQSWAKAVLVQADDKIYVAGYAAPGAGNGTYTTAIARYTKDGMVDSTFGVNGRDTTNLGKWSLGLAATITPNNSVLVAGYSYYQRPGELTDDILLLQYLSGLELGVVNLSTNNQPKVYPNPVSSIINLSYTLEEEDVLSIHLLDISGRVVQTFKKNEPANAGKHTNALEVNSSLPAGTYILQMAGTSGSYAMKLQLMR